MSHPEDQRAGSEHAFPFDRPAPPPGAGAPPPPPPPPPPGAPVGAPAYGRPPAPPAPPPYGRPTSAPPPPGYPQTPYGAYQGHPPYGATATATKPPRPAVTMAAILLLAGSALMVIGSFLPWLEGNGGSINGFDDTLFQDDATGPVYVFFAVVFTGFAVTFLAARRVLSVAIISVVLAAFTVLVTFGDFSDLSDLRDLLNSAGGNDVSYGVGLPVVVLGAFVALAGSIAALAKRRR